MTYHLNDEELVARWRAGEGMQDIADRYGCSIETVRRRLRPLVGPLAHGGIRRGRSEGRDQSLPARLPRIKHTAPSAPVVARALSPLDADVLRDGHTWAGRAAIAKKHAVPMGVVETRFHRLRVMA